MNNYIKLITYHRERFISNTSDHSALYTLGGTYSKANDGTPGAGNMPSVHGREPGWPLGEVGGFGSGVACGGRKWEHVEVNRESQKYTGAG